MRALVVCLAVAFAAACGGHSDAGGRSVEPPAGEFTVSVVLAGNQAGRVTSTPEGLDCRSAAPCSAKFPAGASVTLTAKPDLLSKLEAWSGACSGTSCAFTVTGDATATARFADQRYRVVELGAPTGGLSANAMSISASARYVTGVCTSGPDGSMSFLWNGTMQRLALPFGFSTAVNDSGVVVGELMVTAKGNTHAFRWKDGRSMDLGTLGDPLTTVSSAKAVNAAGIVVGSAEGPDGMHAVSWDPSGAIKDLGLHSDAFGINAEGVVVGATYVADPLTYRHAVRFRPEGGMDDLGGSNAAALAVNSAGLIVGAASFVDQAGQLREHGFVYTGGKMIDAGTLPGAAASKLVAVNAAGIAVGYTYLESKSVLGRGIVYAAGRLIDLNDLVDGASLSIVEARGIADTGEIAAWGARQNQPSGAILLRPE